jgi:hypothetical protein
MKAAEVLISALKQNPAGVLMVTLSEKGEVGVAISESIPLPTVVFMKDVLGGIVADLVKSQMSPTPRNALAPAPKLAVVPAAPQDPNAPG